MEDQTMKRKFYQRVVTVFVILIISVIATITLTQCQAPGYEGMVVPNTQDKSSIQDAVSKPQDTSPSDKGSSNGLSIGESDVSQNKKEGEVKDTPVDRDTVDTANMKSEQELKEKTEVPIFQKTDGNFIWFNSEPHNYTVKFPDWMNKKVTEDDNLVLSGNSLGKEVLDDSEKFTTPHFTITTMYHSYNKYTDGDFDEWFTALEGTPDEVVSYMGATLKLTSVDSGGPYMRRAFVPIAISGAVQLDLVYYSTFEIADEKFNTKVKEAFYSIINWTQELFLSM